MLSGVLRSKVAVQVNINIMRAFVAVRQAIAALQSSELRYEQVSHKLHLHTPRLCAQVRGVQPCGEEAGGDQAVKRNMERFPQDFMIRLTKEEWDALAQKISMT